MYRPARSRQITTLLATAGGRSNPNAAIAGTGQAARGGAGDPADRGRPLPAVVLDGGHYVSYIIS